MIKCRHKPLGISETWSPCILTWVIIIGQASSIIDFEYIWRSFCYGNSLFISIGVWTSSLQNDIIIALTGLLSTYIGILEILIQDTVSWILGSMILTRILLLYTILKCWYIEIRRHRRSKYRYIISLENLYMS